MSNERRGPSGTGDDGSQPKTPRVRYLLSGRFTRSAIFGLALLVGSGVSVAGWYEYYHHRAYLPIGENRAYAVLRVAMTPDGENQPREICRDEYVQSQVRMMKSDTVMRSALNSEGITDLALLKNHSKPIEWLQEQVEFDDPAYGFIRISLKAPRTKDSAILINALVKAYMRAVEADQEVVQLKSRMDVLRKTLSDLKDKIASKENALAKLAHPLKGGEHGRKLREQLRLESFMQLHREISQVSKELRQVESSLRFLEEKEISDKKRDPPKEVIDYAVAHDPSMQKLEVKIKEGEGRLSNDYGLGSDGVRRLHAQLDRARADLELTRIDLRYRLREGLLNPFPDREAALSQLRRQRDLLDVQKRKLRDTIATYLKTPAQRIGLEDFELVLIKQDIARSKKTAASLAADLQRVEIQLSVKRRVTVHQWAGLNP